MASQKDVQDLLRLLTSGRNKLPMLAAMGRIKALQGAGFRSIETVASADLGALSKAIGDDKAAKQLQTAAKNNGKDASKKRVASEGLSAPDAKRKKSVYELDGEPQTPQAIEAGLALPQPSADEEEIAKTTIYTNRAPLVLSFAVSLLKFTMPEQPISSRLSLAQALVSANSHSKAASLGIATAASAEREGWGNGQPTVKIMGRDIHVLKRGGYDWGASDTKLEEEKSAGQDAVGTSLAVDNAATDTHVSVDPESSAPTNGQNWINMNESKWAVSQSVTLKKSTFVARAIGINSSAQARSHISELLSHNPELRDASHNITAWRVQTATGAILEDCADDGENGGGHHVLSLLQSTHLTGVLVVLTRWYGGIMLGTDRWRLMTDVCRDALSQRLRIAGTLGNEALWGLDLEVMKAHNAPLTGGVTSGMPIHRPEAARAYIMKAFASTPSTTSPTATTTRKKVTGAALEREREHNLGLLLAALDLLYASWVEHISRDDLDRRAWSWYVQVRPEVESGPAGWGSKGPVRLLDILNLRRRG
ncbi:MAG: hypothetical protein M1818_005190 [Claussenomyces sp. TS43310]|nr:MAG: hypothetical protein M1818_005190 [Claussenomyces sp. TS43310]